MRVISLGIRTVPVLSVAKELASPRRAPATPVAMYGRIRQDEADWLWLSIGCWKTFALLLTFSSLLKAIKGRGELTECSKLTCFAKRKLHMVPGAMVSEIDDRTVSATIKGIVFVLVRSKASWGKRKKRPNTPKKSKKPSSTHEYNYSRTSPIAELKPKFDRRTAVCMHACIAQLQCMISLVNSVELGTSNDSV